MLFIIIKGDVLFTEVTAQERSPVGVRKLRGCSFSCVLAVSSREVSGSRPLTQDKVSEARQKVRKPCFRRTITHSLRPEKHISNRVAKRRPGSEELDTRSILCLQSPTRLITFKAKSVNTAFIKEIQSHSKFPIIGNKAVETNFRQCGSCYICKYEKTKEYRTIMSKHP